MAQPARSYAPKRRYEEYGQPQIQVHPGRGRAVDNARYAYVLSMFKLACALLAVITVVGVARVWLTNASMDTLTQTSTIAASIEDARAIGSELEVQYLALTNPARVKPYAADVLGMAPAATTVSVDLTFDAVKGAVPAVIAGVADKTAQYSQQIQAGTAAGTVTPAMLTASSTTATGSPGGVAETGAAGGIE